MSACGIYLRCLFSSGLRKDVLTRLVFHIFDCQIHTHIGTGKTQLEGNDKARRGTFFFFLNLRNFPEASDVKAFL